MRRTPFLRLFAAIAFLITTSLFANEDVPHEKKGFQESGYALSQNENINLANGNLTYQVPLFTLRTDGGLEYPLTAFFNMKTWYTHRYCSLSLAGYDTCSTEGGEILSAEVADGVEAYGFGWDMRPPRVINARLGSHQRHPAVVDASGARHLLRATPPWSQLPDDDTAIDFTSDGSNYRLTTVLEVAGRATKIRMEDGRGAVYIFDHIVPDTCDADLNDPVDGLTFDKTDLTPFNFKTQKAGLYLTEIQRGPWRSGGPGGIPENKITFTYEANATTFDSECNEQWLLSSITAHGEENRSASFAYTTLGSVSVLANLTIPTFDPTLGSNAASPNSTTIDWSVSSALFQQFNGTQADTMTFNAPRLDSITLPEGATFDFTQGIRGFMTSVTLPSGALVEYAEDTYPVGIAGWTWNAITREEESRITPNLRNCGAEVPPRDLPPDILPNDPLPSSRPMKSRGVKSRTITYADASAPSGARQETTLFTQGLNCVGIDLFDLVDNGQWPYYFDPFLRDDNFLMTEYLFTVVTHQPGGGSAVTSTGSAAAEIHRFHPLTREEFSVDYVEGPEAWGLHVLAGSWPYPEGIGKDSPYALDVRVLRHTEIEKAVLPGNDDDKDLDVDEDRYTFDTQTRTFTDTTSAPANQGVTNCYEMVTPGAIAPIITCTEVRQTTDPADVDSYFNVLRTTTESFFAPAGFDVGRTVTATYAYSAGGDGAEGEYVWTLGLKTGETVTENGTSSAVGFFWQNISDIASTVQRNYVLSEQTVNPTPPSASSVNSTLNTNCTTDCVLHQYFFDDGLGNLTRDVLSGGSGSGFGSLNTTTRTTFRHGRAKKKELESSTDSMLLWEREVDPSTGLTRWHVDGSGIGFAYLFDDASRFTDIAPIDGNNTQSRATWDISLQTTLIDDVVTPMKGSHIEYVLPGSGVLFEHLIYDATWSNASIVSQLTQGSFAPLSPRSTFLFDGLGRLTQETEAYPAGTRSRYHVSYLHGGTELCNESHAWDLANKSRVNLDSEWLSGTSVPACPQAASWSSWTETQLDGLGRPAVIYSPDDSISTIAYSGDAVKTTTRKIADSLDVNGDMVPSSFTTTTISDGFGRLRRLEEEVSKSPATTYVTTYGYNERDQLTDVNLYNAGETASQHRGYGYWDAGFVKMTSEPERDLDLQGYNAAGDLTREVTLGTGVVVNHNYDDFGRLLNTKKDSTAVIEQDWGNPHGGGGALVGQPSYNQVEESTRHNLFGGSDVAVTHQWVYNGPGARPSSRKTLISGIGAPDDGFQISYGHDTWGNQNKVVFPFFNGCRYSAWEWMESSYDGEWMTDTHIETHVGVEKAIGQVAYHPSGRISSLDYGNGFASWLEIADPNMMARPREIQLWVNSVYVAPGSMNPFGFDHAGNIWKIGSKRYSYDGLSRLEEYSVWGEVRRTLFFEEGYSVDRWGNLTAIDRPTSKTNSTRANYLTFDLEDANPADGVPDSNRIAAVTSTAKAAVSLGWDFRGNLWQQGAIADLRNKEYLWTFDDRLKQSTDDPSGTPTIWRFAYDATGERVMRWYDNPAGLEAKIFVRDEDGQVVSEWDHTSGGASFDVTRDFVAVGRRSIAQIDHSGGSESVEYFSADHLGSTRVVFDDFGTLLETMAYMPFGDLDGAVMPPDATHLFTGHERDLGVTSSQLDFMHARYYSPALVRFLSPDPVEGEVGGSQSWNRYSYVLNNPVKFVDPDGMEEDIGWRTGEIVNESSQTVWIAFDADGLGASGNNLDMRIPLKPGESSATFTSDADALIVAPGQTMDGKGSGAFKVRMGTVTVTDGEKSGELKLETNLAQKADPGQGHQDSPPKQWQLRKVDKKNQDQNRAKAKETKPEREQRIRKRKSDKKPWWKFRDS